MANKKKIKKERTSFEIEQEASIFACLLLMPKQCIEEDLAEPIDLCEDGFITKLAKKYQVPENAVAFRLAYYKTNKI